MPSHRIVGKLKVHKIKIIVFNYFRARVSSMYSKKAIDCSDSMEETDIMQPERRDKQKSRQRYKSRQLSGLSQDPCPSNGPICVVERSSSHCPSRFSCHLF